MSVLPSGERRLGLLDAYRPMPGVHDAMVDAGGGLREEWARIGRVLDGLGPRELRHRRGEAARLLADDGVSYQIAAGADGAGQRWELDPLPVVVSSAGWAEVERGVIQRAELLNLVLSDLYGPRELVRRGAIAPELVFGHPGFLREVDGVRIPGSQQLFTCAVDIARDADGRFWALSDRTQAPSGDGYALENRLVVSRVFPSMHRDAQVHRLAPFFRTLRAALQASAPPGVDDPRIVVLTPGPWSATAFEHAYLASSLGYPMVEGSDLTVRDGRVWLRSLGRLEPVDVILRRVDAGYCDPLELRSDSLLGVPGLVEAARLGAVSVVNTLGSGVLENPALLALLPALARRLLGQDLRLPSVPTWWCGDDAGRSHVLSRLDQLVIKSITREPGAETVVGWALSAAELDALRRRIEARPHGWVGQERLDLATVPALTSEGVVPRRSVMRAFLVARHESYVAMPGGLARVTAAADGAFIAGSTGGPGNGAVSKDIWVVASEPEDLGGFWLQTDTPDAPAAATEDAVSARAAENLFWMGRYAERAEAVVRLLRVVADRRTMFASGVNPAGTQALRLLLAALGTVTGVPVGQVPGDGPSDAVSSGLRTITTDAARPGTLAFAVHKLRDAAYPVRDQLSADTWLVMGALERELLEPAHAEPAQVEPAVFARVLTSLLALSGLSGEAMVRDHGWRFLDTGRRIERASGLVALLRATVATAHDTATDSLLWESVLTAAESVITYRRRYRSHAQLTTLLDLLLLDPENPRSVAHQFDRLAEDVAALGGAATRGAATRGAATGGAATGAAADGAAARLTEPERLVLECSTALRLADVGPLVEAGHAGERAELVAFLDRLAELLRRTADAIEAAHFTRPLPQRPMPALRLA